MNDLTILSLGAGVQSTTVALMAAARLIEPMPDAAIFADTGWEPRGVYDNLRWLTTELPYPVKVVSARRTIRQDIIDGVNSTGQPFLTIPARIINPDGSKGLSRRQCTAEYKIRPITQGIRSLLGVAPKERVDNNVRVEEWFGISTDEAIRMRDSKFHYIDNRYPLIELNMSRNDCLAWLRQHYPDQATPRSACVGCPFRTNEEWIHLRDDDPDGFQDAVDIDYLIREPDYPDATIGTPYLHSSYKPLDIAVAEYEEHKAANPTFMDFDAGFGEECEGMCGV